MNNEITILGKSYAIRSDVDDRFMQETASLVDQKMRELLSKSGSLSTERVAILTAMNFAGQYLREQHSSFHQKDSFQKTVKKLLDLIDSSL